MIKIFALLAPLYVTVFWMFILNDKKKTHSAPRSFLAKLMLLLVILNLARFAQHAPLPQLYTYIDVLYLFTGVICYPLYHIYFRLLTVDENVSLKKHYPYLVVPCIIGIVYLVSVVTTPYDAYKVWLFDRTAFITLPQIRLLKLLRLIVIFVVDFQAVVYLIWNMKLLRKYNDRAEKFYSNIDDGKYNNANTLNMLVLFNCLIHVFNAIHLLPDNYNLIVFSILYAIDYYMIGYMGLKQKPVNPTFETEPEELPEHSTETRLNVEQKKMLDKLRYEFEHNKVFLNCELTILDVVKIIGSNRTYVSSLINQEFNQNFCSFVNEYRLNELERVVREDLSAIHESLAERAGFGSVKSMKRAILSRTGLTFSEWKQRVVSAGIKSA